MTFRHDQVISICRKTTGSQIFHACNLRRLDEAQSALEAFRHKVKQKVFEWEFAQAGQAVIAALNPSELEDLMHDLLTDEALRGVQDRFNAVFAELDVEMRAIDAPTRGLLADAGLEQLDALASSGGGQLGELLDGRAVARLIQAHKQPWVEHPVGLGGGQLLRVRA